MIYPFTKRVWLASLDENELVYGCLPWPRPTIQDLPFPRGAPFPRIPVLVLDGLLDQATPLRDSSRVAAAWPDAATFIHVANTNHISTQVDFLHCVSGITRRFLAKRATGDTSCAGRVPAQIVVPAFSAEYPALPSSGPRRPRRPLDEIGPPDRVGRYGDDRRGARALV